jgi:cephalosporin-C deacetylase
MFVDMPLPELQSYRPDIGEPDDFDQFWSDRLADARGSVAAPVLTPADTPLIHQDVFDVTFPGAGGDPIKGWLSIPRNVADNRPVIIEFVGYNGGRGDPLDWLGWPASGFPHFIMDNRGQGGGWRRSDTPDPSDNGAPSSNGFLTRGIADPKSHFYTRMFVDAVRAVDAVTNLPMMAGRQVVVTGASQGGALALVAAHLHPAVVAALPDVPFLCHIQRGSAVTPARPYAEIAEYCSVNHRDIPTVLRTLSYLDIVNHARRTTVPALFSVGLLDEITPASTVFAAYNHYAGPKEIEVYPYNGHEGGGTTQFHAKLQYIRRAAQEPRD